MKKLYEEGNVIELKEGDKIEAIVPNHLYVTDIIENGGDANFGTGDFSFEKRKIIIRGVFKYFIGKYIVIRVNYIPESGNNYAGCNAYYEYICEHVSNPNLKQINLLTENARIIGTASKKWIIG